MKSHLAVSTAVVAGLLAGCGRHDASQAVHRPPLSSAKARVVTLRAEATPAVIALTGTIRPIRRAQLAAKVMGAVEELPVMLGQRVRRGDVLVKISADEIKARVAQATSHLNAARRDLERERGLLPQGASTADMVKGLADRVAGAEAMLRESEVMLSYATLRAPFDGIIARKQIEVGDLASPGLPLLELEDTAGFEVEAGLPDSLAATLVIGAALEVTIPSAGVAVTGKLVEFSSAADPAARTVTAKIALPENRAIRSGQFARIQVPGAVTQELLAPASALAATGQMESVFVVTPDNRAGLRLVKTGGTRGERVEILSGIDPGERVVIDPPAGMRDGQPLEILP